MKTDEWLPEPVNDFVAPAKYVLEYYHSIIGHLTEHHVNRKVRLWFQRKAFEKGFAVVRWFPDITANGDRGCVLFVTLPRLPGEGAE